MGYRFGVGLQPNDASRHRLKFVICLEHCNVYTMCFNQALGLLFFGTMKALCEIGPVLMGPVALSTH